MKIMHHFYDPSIKPVVTTDMDGNILFVRTYGLNYYGYPDIIMEHNTENYEDIIYAIIDRIFNLDFKLDGSWNYNGIIFKLEIDEESTSALARIVFSNIENVKIITILNPITGDVAKYKSKGLTELYNHSEAEIEGSTQFAKEILSYLIEQIKKGEGYDEDCTIYYDDLCYDIKFTTDRIGRKTIEIILQIKETFTSKRSTVTDHHHHIRYLKRIK
jgi:hypothetical protein